MGHLGGVGDRRVVGAGVGFDETRKPQFPGEAAEQRHMGRVHIRRRGHNPAGPLIKGGERILEAGKLPPGHRVGADKRPTGPVEERVQFRDD